MDRSTKQKQRAENSSSQTMKAHIARIYNRCHWAIRKDLDHAPLQMGDFGEYKKDEYEDTQ